MSANTSEHSETDDSIDDHTAQVPHVKRSKVWVHFKQDLVDVDGDLNAVCKYCGL
uniref:BED-type domain-containing protein n=1 Tax=Arundo donax TaxID=35708 RepID=A0A0A9FJK1_ARUDO